MKIRFARGSVSTDKPTDLPLKLNNCGIYRDMERPIHVSRPRGRSDYQFIFIEKGKMDFEFGERKRAVGQGCLVIYRPNEAQYYTSQAQDAVSYAWIHATGNALEEVLLRLNLSDSVYSIGKCPAFFEICNQMIDRCTYDDACAECQLAGLFLLLLGEISSLLFRSEKKPYKKITDRMERDRIGEVSIADYARACKMSHAHFSRTFKEAYGVSPSLYRVHLLCEKSKIYLTDTALPIAEISFLVGFDDPLYYSRSFKKMNGISPRQYRNMHRAD